MKILIADALSDKALGILTAANLSADVKTGLKAEELQSIIGEYDAVVVRSATKITKDIIAKGDKLRVIGRAGIGVDNVDVQAATEKGIVVMNTPQGNALAAAEHTIGLMFAAARKIGIADRTMKQGKWEKKALMGVEVYGKTMGVIGIGNIGIIVAEKVLALGMKVLAYDIFISKEFAASKGIELVDLDTLLKESDFITVHVPLVKETRGLINKDTIAKMKKSVIIINVARGPVVNEGDLNEALRAGRIAGAALDVFNEEPPPKDYPLVLCDNVVCTPHLGASTAEAQDKVAIDIANQIVDFFQNGVIKNSVNAPSVSFDVAKKIAPYLKLAENLGALVSAITEFPIKEIQIQYMGDIAETDTKIITQGIVKSILSKQIEGVNYVNAPSIAKSRDVKIMESKMGEHEDFTCLLAIIVKGDGKENAAYGTLLGKKEPRLIRVNKIYLEAELTGQMVFLYTNDKPGVIASVGNVFAKHNINIGGMHFGRENIGGLAITLLDVDIKVEDKVVQELTSLQNVLSVKMIDLA
ncbi:MAG: phosphoglycerate dehydrogenase [Syntrophorhabdus sp.]|jgi:D-3-phosphoglycerate dehydrogenase